MKEGMQLVISLPFFLAGLVWEWMCDYFARGRAYYDYLSSE